LIVCIGCAWGPAVFLSGRDWEIKDSTQAIEIARDDAQRAKAHSSRGAAYSEKARYSRLSKPISNDEYDRLFDLAMRDHNQLSRSIQTTQRVTSTGRRRNTIGAAWT